MLLVVTGFIYIGVFLVRKIETAEQYAANIGTLLNALSPVSLMVVLLIAAAAAVFISIKISIGIVEKEEY